MMRLFRQQAPASAQSGAIGAGPDESADPTTAPWRDPLDVVREQLAEIEADRTARIEGLRLEREAHRTDIDERDGLLAATVASWEQRCASLEASHSDELARLHAERADELARLESAHAEALAQRDAQADDIRAAHESALAALVSEQAERVDALERDRESVLLLERGEREAEREQAARELVELQGRDAAVIASLRSELTGLREQCEGSRAAQESTIERIEALAQAQLCAPDETDPFLIGANDVAVRILDAIDGEPDDL